MHILPYKIDSTNELLTSRAGLLTIVQVMQAVELEKHIDKAFPAPKSNRGFKPSVFINALILMMHEGSCRLDDVRHIRGDQALRALLNLDTMPQPSSLGAWLRKTGKASIQDAWCEVNRVVLKAALHTCKAITLDIDATEIIAHKAEAKWTYKKNKSYMPMVGHIAQTGQIVAVDFREGNVDSNFGL